MSTSSQEKDYALIQRFFDFDLSDKEVELFEQRMETDAAFQRRFQLFSEMDQVIEQTFTDTKENNSIKKKFKADLKDTAITSPPKQKIFSLNRIMSIAAAVALVLVSLIGIRYFLPTNNPSELAMTYWEDSNKTLFTNLRSDDELTTAEQQLITASDSFNNQNYTAAIAILDQVQNTGKEIPKVALLKGQCYLELNQVEQAIDNFQVVLDHPSGEYRSAAMWYQALAYVAANQSEKGKQLLQEIIRQKYPTATQAKELLKVVK